MVGDSNVPLLLLLFGGLLLDWIDVRIAKVQLELETCALENQRGVCVWNKSFFLLKN